MKLYLELTNILVILSQIRYNEVFHITNPRYNEPISPVPWHFVYPLAKPQSSFQIVLIQLINIETLFLLTLQQWITVVARIYAKALLDSTA